MKILSKIIRLLILHFLREFAVGHGALLYSEIAEGLCKNLNQFLDSKSLALKLEEHHVTPRITPSLFRFTKCAVGRKCVSFKYAYPRASARKKGGVALKSPLEIPGYKRKVMVELRAQLPCRDPRRLPCVYNCNGPPPPRPRGAEEEKDAGLPIEQKLQKHAKETQADILKILNRKSRSMGFEVESMWILNMIFVSGADVATVKELLKDQEDVKDIRLEDIYTIPLAERADPGPETRDTYPWWHQITDVPRVHAEGYDGTGVVVGIFDSGVDALHYALRDNFRKEYGWFDPYYKTETPNDSEEHGTHVAGIAVGKSGLGVAPGATWIACKHCLANNVCVRTAQLICAQFFFCPMRPNGSDPNCEKRPNIVNNSWGFLQSVNEPSGSAIADNYMEHSIQCWREKKIIPVYCAANVGPKCGTMAYPGASPQVLTIANVAQNFKGPLKGIIHYSSSRGPAHADWGNQIKPEFSAPGTDIRSSIPGNQLDYFTGTSMAAPHVVGIIALMLQRKPSLDFDGIKAALIESCGPVYPSDQLCGGRQSTVYPNYVAGYGLVNAYKAVFANSSAHLPTWSPPKPTIPASTRHRVRRSTATSPGIEIATAVEADTDSTPHRAPITGYPTFPSRKTLIPPGGKVTPPGTRGTAAPGSWGTRGTGAVGTGGTRGTPPPPGPPGPPGTAGPTPPRFTAFTRYTRKRLITKEFTGNTRPTAHEETTTGRYDPLLPRNAFAQRRPRSFRQFY